jgi:hypothetical protein
MKKVIILVAVLSIIVGLSSPASAQINVQDSNELGMDILEVDRKAIITANLRFTEDESKAFWPVYNMYRSDVKTVNGTLMEMIEKYADHYESLSNEMAAELMAEAMDIEEDRMILKQVYVKNLTQILPMKKVVVLFQLENKIDAQVRYDLAEQIPFVQISDDVSVEQ